WSSDVCSSDLDDAANITTEKIIINSLDFVMLTLLLKLKASGSNGSSCDRVKKTAKSDGIPKSNTILKFTFLSMVFLILPTAEVLPTIIRESAVANKASIPTTYTKIRTVKIDPRLPTTPKVTPIKSANAKPM